jgi:hypothetical protein
VTRKKTSRKRADRKRRRARKAAIARRRRIAASAAPTPPSAPPPAEISAGDPEVEDWLPPPPEVGTAGGRPLEDWLPPPPPIPPPSIDDWLPPEPPVETAADDEAPPLEPAPSPATSGWLIAADLTSLGVIGSLMFLNLANTGGTARAILALAFVTCVPGWALARTAGLANGLTGIAVAVLASLTICAAGSIAMVWLDAWHPFLLLGLLAAFSAIAILWTLPSTFVAARLRA